MSGPFLVQDWLTLRGEVPTPSSPPPDPWVAACTLYPHRDTWVATGNAMAITLSIEVKSVQHGSTATPPNSTVPPALRIETAVCEVGPWYDVSPSGGYTTPGTPLLNLTSMGGTPPLLQVLRWAVDTNTLHNGDTWSICFRIVGMRIDLA